MKTKMVICALLLSSVVFPQDRMVLTEETIIDSQGAACGICDDGLAVFAAEADSFALGDLLRIEIVLDTTDFHTYVADSTYDEMFDEWNPTITIDSTYSLPARVRYEYQAGGRSGLLTPWLPPSDAMLAMLRSKGAIE